MSTKRKPFAREHFPDDFCPRNRLQFMNIYSLLQWKDTRSLWHNTQMGWREPSISQEPTVPTHWANVTQHLPSTGQGEEAGLIHGNLKINPNTAGGKWESKGTTAIQNPFGNFVRWALSQPQGASIREGCLSWFRMASHRYPQSPFPSHGTYKHAVGAAGRPDGPTQPCGLLPITASFLSLTFHLPNVQIPVFPRILVPSAASPSCT